MHDNVKIAAVRETKPTYKVGNLKFFTGIQNPPTGRGGAGVKTVISRRHMSVSL